MDSPTAAKRKRCAFVGYWVNYEISNFDAPLTVILHFSRPNFEIIVSGELLFWLIWNAKETPQLDWIDFENLPYDLTHVIDLEYLKTKVWNILITGIGGLLDMELKGCKLIFQDHNHDLWVKLAGLGGCTR